MKQQLFLAVFVILLRAACPAPAAVTFVFNGIDTWPARAKTALEEAAEVVGNWFQDEGVVTISVSQSVKCDGTLGGAGSSAYSTNAGFQYTKAHLQALSNSVPAPHATFEANFCPKHNWDYRNVITGRGADFRAMAMHELLHCLGWFGQLEADPRALTSWGIWDRYVTDSSSAALINPATFAFYAGKLSVLTAVSSGMYFNGPYARAANNDQPARLQTLDPWDNGSSCYHNAVRGSLMYMAGGGGGMEARSMSAVESAIMQDLGYTLTASTEFAAPQRTVTEPDAEADRRAGLARAAVLTNWVDVVIVRHGNTQGPGSVDYRTVPQGGKGWAGEGRNYLAASGTMSFAAGMVTGQFQVAVLSDTNLGATVQQVLLTLRNPQGGLVLNGFTNMLINIFNENGGPRQTLLREEFSQPQIPAGWRVETNDDETAYWRCDNPAGRPNQTGGRAGFAIADSAQAGAVGMDTELITPPLDLEAFDYVSLEFNYDYPYLTNACDELEVGVSTNGMDGPWEIVWSAPWIEFTRWVTNPVVYRSGNYTGPRAERVDITEEVDESTNVLIRFHYYSATNATWFALDNVRVFGYVDYEDRTNDVPGELPAWWQELYFAGDPTNQPDTDADHDGYDNLAEMIAGTDPTDQEDLPEIEGVDTTADTQAPYFFAQAGRTYRLSYSNLVTGGWSLLAAGLQADSDYITLTNPQAASAVYRLEISDFGQTNRVYAFYAVTNRPPVPADLTASAGTFPDRVRLAWTNAAAAWKYEIRRNSSNHLGSAQSLGRVTASPSDDLGVTPQTTYYYWVQALDALDAAGSGFGPAAAGSAGGGTALPWLMLLQ